MNLIIIINLIFIVQQCLSSVRIQQLFKFNDKKQYIIEEKVVPISNQELPIQLPTLGKPSDILVDGKWQIIQDWSQCTLACGGGLSYQQRMCVPPQNGGQPCQGSSILEKACNEQDCPEQEEAEEKVTERAQFKEMQVFHRPQRYEICELREEDMEIQFTELGQGIHYPGRVVLNNKTISVFTGDSYDSVYKTFDLENLILREDAADKDKCFQIEDFRDEKKKVSLCVLTQDFNSHLTEKQNRDSWVKDIKMFKNECHSKDYQQQLDEIDTKEIVCNDPVIQRQEHEIEDEIQEDKSNLFEKKVQDQKEHDLNQKVDETAKKSLDTIEQEMQYERLAMKEEVIRENEIEKQEEQEIEAEEEKKVNNIYDIQMVQNEFKRKYHNHQQSKILNKQETIERQIKQKEKQEMVSDASLEAINQIAQIEESAKHQVELARSNIYAKIQLMQKAAQKRREQNKRKILEIRTDVAKLVLDQDKKGDKNFCNPYKTETERQGYCKDHMPQDKYDDLLDCYGHPQEYCFACCDNEFGVKFKEYRKQCKMQCEVDVNSMNYSQAQIANQESFIKQHTQTIQIEQQKLAQLQLELAQALPQMALEKSQDINKQNIPTPPLDQRFMGSSIPPIIVHEPQIKFN